MPSKPSSAPKQVNVFKRVVRTMDNLKFVREDDRQRVGNNILFYPFRRKNGMTVWIARKGTFAMVTAHADYLQDQVLISRLEDWAEWHRKHIPDYETESEDGDEEAGPVPRSDRLTALMAGAGPIGAPPVAVAGPAVPAVAAVAGPAAPAAVAAAGPQWRDLGPPPDAVRAGAGPVAPAPVQVDMPIAFVMPAPEVCALTPDNVKTMLTTVARLAEVVSELATEVTEFIQKSSAAPVVPAPAPAPAVAPAPAPAPAIAAQPAPAVVDLSMDD